MKMTYTTEEIAVLTAKGMMNDYYTIEDRNTYVKEMRAAAKWGMTVDEMRAKVAHDNKVKSLTIKKARLEKELAQVTATLAKLGA